MSVIEEKLDRLELIRKTSFILINETMYCLLYFLRELNRPSTIARISKDLGADQNLIADHMQALLMCGFVTSGKGKFGISDFGRQAVRITEEGVGRVPHAFIPAAAPSFSEIEFNFDEASSSDGALQVSLSISFPEVLSAKQRSQRDKFSSEDKSRFSSEDKSSSEDDKIDLSEGPESARTEDAANIQYNL